MADKLFKAHPTVSTVYFPPLGNQYQDLSVETRVSSLGLPLELWIRKVSTLVLIVDLDCDPCYKKIRKAVCKFPEIQSQSFDEKQKKVTISGPFEPEKLIKKLYCKVGCKIIIRYEIPEPPKPPVKQRTPSTSPPKTKPAEPVPGPVNILIGPIGPVCCCMPFRLPDCPDPVDCTCRLPNPTCHSRPCGSRGHCQCGGQCGGRYQGGHHFFSDHDKECKMM